MGYGIVNDTKAYKEKPIDSYNHVVLAVVIK